MVHLSLQMSLLIYCGCCDKLIIIFMLLSILKFWAILTKLKIEMCNFHLYGTSGFLASQHYNIHYEN